VVVRQTAIEVPALLPVEQIGVHLHLRLRDDEWARPLLLHWRRSGSATATQT
jgi:hypothetical protein